MNPLLYLIQVVIASGILYLYYHIALRDKQFHQYNRFYLLGAVVISILVPFLNIPVYFTPQETQSSIVFETLTVISATGPDVTERPSVIESSAPAFNPYDLIYYTYILVALLAWARIMYSLLRISRLKRNNTVEKIDTIFFINTDEQGTPFSFFRWMFWNRSIELHSEKGEQIFRHELYHIRQKHSIDLLCMELLTMICWINPFFHLMKKELRAIHEFLADRFAVTRSNKWDYAELLLMQALKTKHSLVNPFFHNQIKRRIAMITDSKKTSYRYLRKLLVLPIAVLIVTVFAFNYKKANTGNDIPAEQETGISKSNVLIDTPKVVYEKVEIEASFPGGVNAWRAFLEKNLNADIVLEKKAKPGTYSVFIQFMVDKEGNASDFKALTAHGYGMEEEALRVLRKATKWNPAIHNGKPVNSFRKQPVIFKILSDKEDKEIQRQIREKESNPKNGSNMADNCLEIFRNIPKIIIPAEMAKGGTTTYIQPVTFTISPGISISDLKKSTPHQLLEIDKNAHISTFTFTIDLPDGTIVQVVNTGNKFNEKTAKLISEAVPGRLITIENIILLLGGNTKKIPAKLYYVNND